MRLLIVRLGALGDIVHALPVAAALRRAHPDAEIDWLVSAKHRAILELVPVVTDRIVVNDRGEGDGGRSLVSAIRELRRRRYDVVFDLQGLLKSAILARSTGAARVIGFAGAHARESAAAWFYTDRYDPGAGGVRSGETMHVIRLNLGMLELVGIRATDPEFPIVEAPSSVAQGVIQRAGGPYALVNPGAAWPNKRWPASRFAALARHLRERHGLRSVVLWGPGERTLADQIAAESAGAAELSPPTTIADLVALARGAALMVSGDTGPLHIAAAVGTPLVGIFGPTRPARNGPWRADDVTVSRWEVCQCHHLRRCRRETMCLNDIEVAELAAAVDQRLLPERARA